MTYEGVPTPIYIIEEKRLRENLELIRGVAREADVEIILAFKAFALWKTFPIFREYISSTTASSLAEARLAAEEFGSLLHRRGNRRNHSLFEPPDLQFADAVRTVPRKGGAGRPPSVDGHQNQSRIQRNRHRFIQSLCTRHAIRHHRRQTARTISRRHRRLPLPLPLRKQCRGI